MSTDKEAVLRLIARYGIVGSDAETAYAAWLRDPASADGGRVQRVLEVHG